MTVKAKEFLETDIADKREKEVNLRKLRLDRELVKENPKKMQAASCPIFNF